MTAANEPAQPERIDPRSNRDVASRWSAHVRALLAILLLSALVVLTYWPFGSPPRWTGHYGDQIISAFIDGGYSYAAIGNYVRDRTPEMRLADLSMAARPGFIWLVALVHRFSGAAPRDIYPVVDWLAFLGTAWLLYAIGIVRFGLSSLGAMFGAIWLLLSIPVLAIFHVQAHPEALGVLLAAGAFLAYCLRRHLAGAALLGACVLTKEAGYFLFAYLAIEVMSTGGIAPRAKARALAPYTIALAAALLLRFAIVRLAVVPALGPLDTLREVAAYVHERGLVQILQNFEVLWPLFFFALASRWSRGADAGTRATLWYTLAVPWVLLFAQDWFRVLFAPLFFLAIPLAATTLEEWSQGEGLLAWRVTLFSTVTLLLIKKQPFAELDDLGWTRWLAMALVIAIAFAADRAWRIRAPAEPRDIEPA